MIIDVLYLQIYMKIVKLNAINSTNTFLRDLARESEVENFTVVVTENQTNGKGQFDNKWTSEIGKNLMFSVLYKFSDLNVDNAFYLNCAISLAIYKALSKYHKEKLKVKWPNDILSSRKKLCGILIENTVSNGKITSAIIGIGLNVNQENFPKDLPNATSLKNVMGKEIDKEKLFLELLETIKQQLLLVIDKQFTHLQKSYEQVLYKKNKPMMFRNDLLGNFLGKILGITKQGKLIIELENETIEVFDLKEIKFI
jgi:BirA family biotin operon repressor/biotin-[acetyl-CoA-carboxylase] ligase